MRKASLKRRQLYGSWKTEKGLEMRTFQAEGTAWANALESRRRPGCLGERSVWPHEKGKGVNLDGEAEVR